LNPGTQGQILPNLFTRRLPQKCRVQNWRSCSVGVRGRCRGIIGCVGDPTVYGLISRGCRWRKEVLGTSTLLARSLKLELSVLRVIRSCKSQSIRA
jgi:hypothetical protein